MISVGFGGAFGAMARLWISTQMYAWLGRDFAWGTLTVNVLGSLAMGLFIAILSEKMQVQEATRSLILVGFLGAFTTFSTFSFETYLFLQNGELIKAILNIVISVISCLLAIGIGLWIGKHII